MTTTRASSLDMIGSRMTFEEPGSSCTVACPSLPFAVHSQYSPPDPRPAINRTRTMLLPLTLFHTTVKGCDVGITVPGGNADAIWMSGGKDIVS